jgi:putative heme-binding domain-containing protein
MLIVMIGHTSRGADAPVTSTVVSSFRVPAACVVELVAGEPLIQYPLFACFDDRGRLYVAEGTGTNLPGAELVKLNLGKITLLEDTDGDGRFDKAKTFADKLVFPQGVLWHDGAVYVASHPAIWKLRDTDGDDVADVREELVGKFGFSGNGCDIHGPFLGPDGWIYWADGRHGHKCVTKEGSLLEGFAARIFRCRPDGRDLERICGGGFDNPVELAFTESGDLIGTMDQGTGDALLHFVAGGVYPRDDQPCLAEFPKTGPLLSPITSFSPALPAALCGLVRLRSDHFGPEFPGTLLTAQFNVHRIQQHTLINDGATFRAVNKDFLTSTNYDLRLTDVLEDADGSLLAVDMGAWFNYGCPTAKIAKPQVKGSIYRIRRPAAQRVDDPWGLSIKLDSMSAEQLVLLLSDPRLKVRDRVVERLVKLGDSAVSEIIRGAVFPRPGGRFAFDRAVPIRQAVWILSRIGTPLAMQTVRRYLSGGNASVKMVAAHCVGLERDVRARPFLATLVVQDELPVRLKAAEALGKIGGTESVAALLASLRRGVSDRFLEHAIIYSLITIADHDKTMVALSDSNPNVRRAGLIALDQMPASRLTRDQVIPLLDTDDPELQQAALDVISRREGWAGEISRLIAEWLAKPSLTETQRTALTGALLANSGDSKLQDTVAAALIDPTTPVENRRALLGVISRSRLKDLPAKWQEALATTLRQNDGTLKREAVTVIRSRGLTTFDQPLADLAARDDAPAELRIAALECLAPRRPQPTPAAFALLTSLLGDSAEPLLRVAAARTIGLSRPNGDQLLVLVGHVAQAGPLTAPLLVPAFSNASDPKIGAALVAALKKSPGTDALTPDELRKLVNRFPAEVQAAAEPLFVKLAAREHEQEVYLTELVAKTLTVEGNPERGRQVFFSKKVGCAGCHRMEGQGGAVGPDLSQIGRFRDPRALMEAVVFPSSTIVPDFRSFTIATREGKTVSGMIVRETSDAIFLRTHELAEIRVVRADVEDISPSKVSIMPQGLEKTMSEQELADLLEFLFQRR